MESLIAKFKEIKGNIGTQEEDLIRADLTLQVEHPRQHVAYIDHWITEKGTSRLIRRVLAASGSADEFFKAVRALPPEGLREIQVRFTINPEPDLVRRGKTPKAQEFLRWVIELHGDPIAHTCADRLEKIDGDDFVPLQVLEDALAEHYHKELAAAHPPADIKLEVDDDCDC